MLVLGIAVAAALLIPLATHGSYKRLLDTEIHWGWLLGGGLVVQLVLEYYTLPRHLWNNVGYGLLVASYGLILLFCARNLLLRGMSIVLIGIACNALVIAVDHGMPAKIPPAWSHQSWTQATVKHHPRKSGDRLLFLTDIIVLRHPFDSVLSFGDLILMVGMCDLAYHASRRPRRRGRSRRAVSTAQRAAATKPAPSTRSSELSTLSSYT